MTKEARMTAAYLMGDFNENVRYVILVCISASTANKTEADTKFL